MKNETITILKIEVGKEPYVKEIGTDLKSLQTEVGGLIQPVYLDHDCLAVVNEEGKLDGSLPNRWLGDNDIICGDVCDRRRGRIKGAIRSGSGQNFVSVCEQEILGTATGDFFICGDDGEEFGSINENQIDIYTQKYMDVPNFSGEEPELEPHAFVIGFDWE